MRAPVSLGLGALLLALAGTAQAQQLENPRTDYTAYTRPGGRLAVGPLKTELGVIDEILVGTYPLPWLAFPFLKATVPNVYVKVRSPWEGPFTLALRGGATYVDGKAIAELADKNAAASALSVVADADASYRIDERFSVSLGFDYAKLSALGGDDTEAASVEGASTAHTYSLRAFGEWRLTRVFALSLLFRYLIYQSPVSLDATSESDSTTITTDLSAESTLQKHFSIVPGVSFAWERWEVSGGIGYGVLYLPVLGLATAKNWPVADLAVAYRFDLY